MSSPSYWFSMESMNAMFEPIDVSRPPKSESPHRVKLARGV